MMGSTLHLADARIPNEQELEEIVVFAGVHDGERLQLSDAGEDG